MLVVSDAWIRHFDRVPYIDQEYAKRLQVGFKFLSIYPVIYEVERPVILGTNDPMHSATYWHQPGITVYCLSESACDAVR
jgi:hypothetical protein